MVTSGWAVIGDSEGSGNDESDSRSSSEPHEMRERLEARAIAQVIRAPGFQLALFICMGGLCCNSLSTSYLVQVWI